MAPFSALRNSWQPLLHPYRTLDLCPVNLCPRGRGQNERLKRPKPTGFVPRWDGWPTDLEAIMQDSEVWVFGETESGRKTV